MWGGKWGKRKKENICKRNQKSLHLCAKDCKFPIHKKFPIDRYLLDINICWSLNWNSFLPFMKNNFMYWSFSRSKILKFNDNDDSFESFIMSEVVRKPGCALYCIYVMFSDGLYEFIMDLLNYLQQIQSLKWRIFKLN